MSKEQQERQLQNQHILAAANTRRETGVLDIQTPVEHLYQLDISHASIIAQGVMGLNTLSEIEIQRKIVDSQRGFFGNLRRRGVIPDRFIQRNGSIDINNLVTSAEFGKLDGTQFIDTINFLKDYRVGKTTLAKIYPELKTEMQYENAWEKSKGVMEISEQPKVVEAVTETPVARKKVDIYPHVTLTTEVGTDGMTYISKETTDAFVSLQSKMNDDRRAAENDTRYDMAKANETHTEWEQAWTATAPKEETVLSRTLTRMFSEVESKSTNVEQQTIPSSTESDDTNTQVLPNITKKLDQDDLPENISHKSEKRQKPTWQELIAAGERNMLQQSIETPRDPSMGPSDAEIIKEVEKQLEQKYKSKSYRLKHLFTNSSQLSARQESEFKSRTAAALQARSTSSEWQLLVRQQREAKRHIAMSSNEKYEAPKKAKMDDRIPLQGLNSEPLTRREYLMSAFLPRFIARDKNIPRDLQGQAREDIGKGSAILLAIGGLALAYLPHNESNMTTEPSLAGVTPTTIYHAEAIETSTVEDVTATPLIKVAITQPTVEPIIVAPSEPIFSNDVIKVESQRATREAVATLNETQDIGNTHILRQNETAREYIRERVTKTFPYLSENSVADLERSIILQNNYSEQSIDGLKPGNRILIPDREALSRVTMAISVSNNNTMSENTLKQKNSIINRIQDGAQKVKNLLRRGR